METPEETYIRVKNLCIENHAGISETIEAIAKLYHQERLKIEMPTDRDVSLEAYEMTLYGSTEGEKLFFEKGANWLKNKLLKGIQNHNYMKSKEILPVALRLKDWEVLSPYINPLIKDYHKSLLAAESEIEEKDKEISKLNELISFWEKEAIKMREDNKAEIFDLKNQVEELKTQISNIRA